VLTESSKRQLGALLMQRAGLEGDATVAQLLAITGRWDGNKSSLPVRSTHVDFVLFHFFKCAFPSTDFDEVTLAMVEEHFELDFGELGPLPPPQEASDHEGALLEDHEPAHEAQGGHAPAQEAQGGQARAQEALDDQDDEATVVSHTGDTVSIVFLLPPSTSRLSAILTLLPHATTPPPPPPSPPSYR